MVPIKTTARKYIINQLLTNIEVSLLNKKKDVVFFFSVLWKKKKTKRDRNIKVNKNIKINKPLSGSFANVCTEFKIPERTKKVPLILKVNVAIDKIITQEVNIDFFSKTNMQCKRVVNVNQGINEIFSTGSQNQNPPQPNS